VDEQAEALTLQASDIKFDWDRNYDEHQERLIKSKKTSTVDNSKNDKWNELDPYLKSLIIPGSDVASYSYTGEWSNAISNYDYKFDGCGIWECE